MKNNKNNKGFSLVELIVVVAIMAVLVAVLAPTLLRYVEKTRVQKDASAVSEVVEAAKIAMAEEDVYQAVSKATNAKATITVANGSKPTCDVTELGTEIGSTIGIVNFSAGKAGTATITVEIKTDSTVDVIVTPSDTSTDWGKAIQKINPQASGS